MADLGMLTVIVGAALVLIFDLMSTSLRQPLGDGYSADGLLFAGLAKTTIETGWVQETSRLGAPFGQKLYDFPIGGDNAHFLIMKGMSWATGDWVLLVNGFFLLAFFTAAWSAYLCQRWLRVGRVAAIVTSSLFAFAPYHFVRGFSHPLLASYFVVPIGVLLAVKAGSAVAEPTDTQSRQARIGRVAPWLLLCSLAGSCGAYYAGFIVVIVIIASLVVAVGYQRRAPLIRGALFVTMITGTFIMNVLGSVLYQRREGASALVANRANTDLDVFALRPSQMLAPVFGHWFRPLADISTDLSQNSFFDETSQYLGLVGAGAFLWMLGWFFAHFLGSDRGSDPVRALLATVTVLLILIGTAGGLSWFPTLVGFNQIRAWGRVSILISFASLCWLGLTLGPLIRAWSHGREPRRFAAFGLAGVVLFVGITDQASIDHRIDPGRVGDFSSDQDFFSSVEAALPTGAMLYQLPYRPFPEAGFVTVNSWDYDLLRPYLNTDDLRWSYGGMKGREAEWQNNLVGLDPSELMDAVLAVGFKGIVIDRFGYADSAAKLSTALQRLLDTEPLTSEDARWLFFDISAQREVLADDELEILKQQVLDYTRIDYQGCWPLEGTGANQFRWCGTTVEVVIHPQSRVSDAEFSLTVVAPGGTGNLVVDVDGERTNHRISPSATTITVLVPADIDALLIRTDAPATTAPGETRDLRFQIFSPIFGSANP